MHTGQMPPPPPSKKVHIAVHVVQMPSSFVFCLHGKLKMPVCFHFFGLGGTQCV